MEIMESLSLILVYQQIIYLCCRAICCLLEYLSRLLYHQNGENTSSASPRLPVLICFLFFLCLVPQRHFAYVLLL